MANEVVVDEGTARKYTLDRPGDDAADGLTFILNLHGGGSVGAWQREYFPAYEHVDSHRLVVATPSAKTKEPFRAWVAEADDEHLRNIVEQVFGRFGERIRSFWLAGHSQGGMTSNRLIRTDFFAERVDGWLSLSGGRLGPAERAADFGPPRAPGQESFRPPANLARLQNLTSELPTADFSFIFTTGEHEIASLPATSPWAERYQAGPRVQLPDVVDELPGKIHDMGREGRSTRSWGLQPRPGTAQIYVYPDALGGRVIADIVRLDKGHTEGLEPRITETIISMMAQAPGGKATGGPA